jgi:phosphoribosylamine--glycine ligase
MAREGVPYHGVLYAGLMITRKGPKVVEFNCRFGDPETQAILPLLKTDLVDLMLATISDDLRNTEVRLSADWALCVIMASGGYPGTYEKGKVILGLDHQRPDDILIFHAGTRRNEDQIVTNGGRVLGVTAIGPDFRTVYERAYRAVGKITFDGAYYRKDIGFRVGKYLVS